MAKPVEEWVRQLGFDPEPDAPLWRQALTHRSAEGKPHYERLEYLGDAVLKLVVSEWLYERPGDLSEGTMTKVRARAVSDEVLAEVARTLKLGDHLVLGAAEKRSKGKHKVGILASALEAVLGVIYLRHGHAAARAFLETHLGGEFETALALGGTDNYKAVLQELSQGRFKSLPEYRLVREIGPEHDRSYEVAVYVDGAARGQGLGRSKKSAEQQAAMAALEALRAAPRKETS
ncbi:MAG: ribonuclease III [Candidatus Sericytochromatia bacterium]